MKPIPEIEPRQGFVQDFSPLIDCIQSTDLDQTIKDILIKDLRVDGLTEFLVEQLKAYTDDNKELKKILQSYDY